MIHNDWREKEGAMKTIFTACAIGVLTSMCFAAVEPFERDTIRTSMGNLVITFIGHGTLMMQVGGKTIHVDPVSAYVDYSTMPKADYILITHQHGDHCDAHAIAKIRTESTIVVLTAACAVSGITGTVLANGEACALGQMSAIAVPAYNLVHGPGGGKLFHPKGEGNGYILVVGGKRVYIAGDTENTPEMKALKNIDVAFLPMNLPYTMTPEMVADAAKAFKPRVLYPYHYGSTDVRKLVELLEGEKSIEVRTRRMQ
jgi:L-ascorbate metabolism protein UlaG (beta-lactamase superfamily)